MDNRHLFPKTMNCFNWTYIGDRNEKTSVGLYHSPKSGNVMLYCDKKILVIDFFVQESKTYSFFIGGELCEVTIEKEGNLYSYGMEINTKADTPRNRARKVLNRKDLVSSVVMMSAFVGAIALVYMGLMI